MPFAQRPLAMSRTSRWVMYYCTTTRLPITVRIVCNKRRPHEIPQNTKYCIVVQCICTTTSMRQTSEVYSTVDYCTVPRQQSLLFLVQYVYCIVCDQAMPKLIYLKRCGPSFKFRSQCVGHTVGLPRLYGNFLQPLLLQEQKRKYRFMSICMDQFHTVASALQSRWNCSNSWQYLITYLVFISFWIWRRYGLCPYISFGGPRTVCTFWD